MNKIFLLPILALILLGAVESALAQSIIKDAKPGVNGSFAGATLQIGNTLYFSADDGTNGVELWKTDGTDAGTVMVKNINPAGASSNPSGFVNLNGMLFFAADDGTNGIELWRSDGTNMGTQMIANVNPAAASSQPTNLTASGTTILYFSAISDANGRELWRWNGMSASLVKDIRTTPTAASSSSPGNFAMVGTTLFFTADDANSGLEVWKSDGTSGGTVLVKNIDGSSVSSAPSSLMAVNNTLFFTAMTVSTGVELWKSDGSDAGTVQVKNINLTISGAGNSNPSFLTNMNGTLFFFALEASNTLNLWKSDGTEGGTVKVNTTNFNPLGVTIVNNVLYFAAERTVSGNPQLELWSSNGTTANIVAFLSFNYSFKDQVSFATAPGNIFYFINSNGTGSDLFVSNGPLTYSVSAIGRPDVGGTSIGRAPVFFVNDKVIFFNKEGTAGTEPWSYTPVPKLVSSQSSPLPFGNISLTAHQDKVITLTNTGLGTVDIALGTPAFTGTNASDFSGGTLGSSTLAPGVSTTYTATFTPAATGVRTATLNIPSSAPASPLVIQLTGTGVKVDQTITFATLASRRFGSVASFTLESTTSSGLAVTYLSSNTAVATVSGNTVTIEGIGQTNITAKQDGDATYNAATDVIRSLTIQKPLLTATAEGKSKTYGADNPTLTIAYTGFLNADNASVIDTPPVASTTATVTSVVGSYPINLTTGSDAFYDIQNASGNLSVTKAPLTITASTHTRVYGGTDPVATLSYSGFVNGENTSVLDTPPTPSIGANNTSNVGDYAIQVNGGSDNNYNFVRVPGTLTITKAVVVAKAETRTKIYGNPTPSLLIIYDDLLFSQTRAVIDTPPTLVTQPTDFMDAGVHNLVLTGGTDNNYIIQFATSPGTLTIEKTSAIVRANPKERIYRNSNPELTFIYENLKRPEDATSIDKPPTITTTATIESNVGGYTIVVSGASDNNYNFTYANSSLSITQATQEIVTASSIDNMPLYTNTGIFSSFDLIAISTGGDKIQVQLANLAQNGGQIAMSYQDLVFPQGTVKGYHITAIQPGPVRLSLSQPGNGNFTAALTVAIPEFCIIPGKPKITSSFNTDPPLLSANYASGGTISKGVQWYLNGFIISGATQLTYTATQAGVYTVRVSVDGCTGDFSDDFPLIVTGTTETAESISFHPNPVHDFLNIQGVSLTEVSWGIADVTGKMHQPPVVQSGEQGSTVDVRALLPGFYILKVNSKHRNITAKMIKE